MNRKERWADCINKDIKKWNYGIVNWSSNPYKTGEPNKWVKSEFRRTKNRRTSEKDAGADFESFRQIIETLQSENGCPWDRAQTLESLKPCMVNEMTEAIAGIDLYRKSGNAENLCEELGDVLLQVVLLSQIAKEEGLFDIDDVIRKISKKMVHRHPHVFGTPEEREKKRSWEELKREEKGNRSKEEEDAQRTAFHEAAGFGDLSSGGKIKCEKRSFVFAGTQGKP